jgi:ribosome-binding protein aMBF1 (putative translation factor)
MNQEESIQARIKEARTNSGLSQELIAQKMRIRTQTICRWEHGLGIEKFAYVRDFILATGCDPLWLLGIRGK